MNGQPFPSEAELEECLLSDRQRFRRRIRTLRKRQQRDADYREGLIQLREAVTASRHIVVTRAQQSLQLQFPDNLPISEHWQEIAGQIARHQVLVLCGETGSGKSTQLPKICLELGRGVYGRIGHTQPRRIAARSLATRVAAEMGQELGATVGYKVRFHDRVAAASRVKLMTDGILLSEIRQKRQLYAYDTLIIDEAHERSLNIDFLLGYLKELLPKRPDLKVIITSATIDPDRFSQHFWNAPVINVSGRSYPVEVRYAPPAEMEGGERDQPMQQAILDAVDQLGRIGRGDILVFLSGEREIRETAESLRKHKLQLTEVLPLYARLGKAEQDRIFRPGGSRRIILATNVAETSLTVPGIRYVIDSGYARISRYSHRSKVQRLPVEPISQASADQRKGRCGRVAAGICIRLYDQEEFSSRAEYTEPEIQRTNLASVILQMKILGFGDIEAFPFVDAPDRRLIKDGYRVLEEIGAVDGERRVTRVGRQLAKLPVDPRIGRMLLSAAHGHCLNELLVIAAALSIQDPRERPLEKQQAADEAHHGFRHPESDFLSYLKLWEHLQEQRRHLSKRKFQHACRNQFLSWVRVQEWHDIHHQLRGQLHEMGYRENQAPAGYEEIHKALLSGLLSHVGCRTGGKGKEYLGARNSRFRIFPGSGQFEKAPKWVLAAELVETSQLYGRVVAGIRPDWVESIAGHLIKHTYSEPRWERRPGQVAANERVTLFGLTLIAKRKINFGPINPQEAREIFIRSALVDRDFHTRAKFWRHNQQLLEYVEELEEKGRRRDLLVDEQRIYEYYALRVPEGIYSTAQFDRWLRKATQKQPKLLHMRLEDLLRSDSDPQDDTLYPDLLDLDGLQLPLSYRFEPGDPTDGVTLKVPQEVLNQVSEARCQWLVPGLLRERVIALLRSLPKNLRKQFVPVPDYADACLARLQPSDKPLIRALSEVLKEMTGVHIPEDAWQESSLSNHLRMRYRILDRSGKTLETGRDLAALKQRHGGSGDTPYHRLPGGGLEREGLTDWDFGELPESVEMKRGGVKLLGFPALVDEGESVSLRVLDSPFNAARETRAGVRRLLMLKQVKQLRYLRREFKGMEQMRLHYARMAAAPDGIHLVSEIELEAELIALAVDSTFLEGQPAIRNGEQFRQRLQMCRSGLVARFDEVLRLGREILELSHQVRLQLSKTLQVNWIASTADLKAQLDRLVFKGCFQCTPIPQLQQIPRYLKAMLLRLDKLAHAANRDRQRLQQMQPLYRQWQEWDQRCRSQGREDERIEELRWHFEELRVSLFAQELGTAYPISLERIEKRYKVLGL